MAKSLTSVNINTWKDKGSNSYRFNHSYTADANYTSLTLQSPTLQAIKLP